MSSYREFAIARDVQTRVYSGFTYYKCPRCKKTLSGEQVKRTGIQHICRKRKAP